MNTWKKLNIRDKLCELHFILMYHLHINSRDFITPLSYNGLKNLWLQRKVEKNYEANLDWIADMVTKYVMRKSK